MMRSLVVVPGKVFYQIEIEFVLVNSERIISVDKLFLDSTVKPFYCSIDLWASGIDKVMGDALFFQVGMKLIEKFRSIVCLDFPNLVGRLTLELLKASFACLEERLVTNLHQAYLVKISMAVIK